MLSHEHLLLLLRLAFFSLASTQSTVYVGIVDDNDYPQGILPIILPNVTFCNHQDLNLQIQWINSSISLSELIDGLEFREQQTNFYLTRTTKLSTKLVQDFSQTHRIPFISMHTSDHLPATSAMPDILRVLISYLKYHHVQRAAYIYDNDESTDRIYELLKLMTKDEYFNNFSLDIRTTRYQDIYSLLYSIEIHTINKEQPPKYILLDLQSYFDYENMFNKISHMGLTGDLYYYIILSTFDTCIWVTKLNFTGRLVYFDYQQRDCTLEYQRSSQLKEESIQKSKHHSSYYRSTLSFRTDQDYSQTLNSSQSDFNHSSITFNSSSDNDLDWNSCSQKSSIINEYFSYAYLLAQLSKSYELYSRHLFSSLNLIIHILKSNLIDCQTLRLKSTTTRIPSNLADVNVYTTRKSTPNQLTKQFDLIGRYSSIHDDYQSCQTEKRRDSLQVEKITPSRVYYITSLFDEPFLMLRKGTILQEKYSQPLADLKELRGHVFDIDQLEGYCVDLAHEVCSILNITCKFRIVQDGAFGSKNSTTGIWNGMVGEIVSRTADMAIAPLTISQVRMEAVEFSKPFMNLGISIMIRKPDAQKPGVFSFMNPVSMEIWLCFSLSYFAVSVVLFLTSRVVNSGWRQRIVRRPSYRSFSYPKSVNDRRKSEIQLQRQRRGSADSAHSSELHPIPVSSKRSTRRRYRPRPRHYVPVILDDQIQTNKEREEELKDNDVHLFGISNALFFSFASFMRQSINLVPKSISGRVAATSWWYFSLIFVSSYTANLVAFVTVERLVTPIESVTDLAKQQEIRYGSLRNGTTSAFFERSNVTDLQHMWAVMQKYSSEVFVATNDEGVAKVRSSKGKYAFFIESTKNEYVNERPPCDTMKIGSDLDAKGYGIATRLGSDLTEAINIIITNLRESGILDKLKQSWWYDRSQCFQSTKGKRFSELSLSSVTGLFYIFLFGIILSCTIAFTEFLITAKAESEKLQLGFREILRIKMIENLVGITINAQRQLEFGAIENEVHHHYQETDDQIIEQYTKYQLNKPQSDV